MLHECKKEKKRRILYMLGLEVPLNQWWRVNLYTITTSKGGGVVPSKDVGSTVTSKGIVVTIL